MQVMLITVGDGFGARHSRDIRSLEGLHYSIGGLVEPLLGIQ
jgi:hypothetical protein